jgi:exopolyphosphatase/guanosine-5'-triphosphate,3'-diphosphate pyrophosphatase
MALEPVAKILRAPVPEKGIDVSAEERGNGPKRHRSRRGGNRRRRSNGHRPRAPKPGTPPRVDIPAEHPLPQDGNIYAALDLGTNNCRLLVARPAPGGFEVIDAFSRTVGLGEQLAASGTLSEASMNRAISALKVCASKIKKDGATHVRAIATEACRFAENGPAFVERVKRETGIEFDIITAGEEAALAAAGCAALADPTCENVLVFDIGGGSTELVWLDLCNRCETTGQPRIVAWTSLPCGVVNLTDLFRLSDPREDDECVGADLYNKMVDHVRERLRASGAYETFADRPQDRAAHLLGTSGTVTTVAGIALGLKKYDRRKVDGTWLHLDLVHDVSLRVAKMSRAARARHPCIGPDRAEFIVSGCAILEAIRDLWPCDRLRVADRGLREGILIRLMAEAGDSALARERILGAGKSHSLEHGS